MIFFYVDTVAELKLLLQINGKVQLFFFFPFFYSLLTVPLCLQRVPFFLSFIFFFDSLLLHFSLPCSHLSLSFKLATGVGLDSEWSRRGGVGVVPAWRRSKWSRRGGDRREPGMEENEVVMAWARWIPMGLFDFLLLIFVFQVWMGWILDSYCDAPI